MPAGLLLGTTSFVLPDYALPNVEWLAGKVDDVQLLLLEPEGDLPSSEDIARMVELGRLYGLRYSVHLPSILVERDPASLDGILRLAALAAPLQASRWVFHVEPAPPAEPAALRAWIDGAARVVREISERSGLPLHTLEVENQSEVDLDAHRAIVDAAGCSLCLDLGHVFAAGGDPCRAIERHLAVAPHLHVHGFSRRDHASLEYFPPLERVLAQLTSASYRGVITMEVFGREAFERSLEAVRRATRHAAHRHDGPRPPFDAVVDVS